MNVFEQLRHALNTFEAALPAEDGEVGADILRERTHRVSQEPKAVDTAVDVSACLVFARNARTYAIPLEMLQDVTRLGHVAPVPGIPSAYLGVTARKGAIVTVLDLPRVFSVHAPFEPPGPWLLTARLGSVVAGVAADEVHDLIEIHPGRMAQAMPTFPAIAQRHTIGVLEDRTVVLDLIGLLGDRSLRVEDKG